MLQFKFVQNKIIIFKMMTFKTIWARVVQYFVEICGLIKKNWGFVICGEAHLRNLRICDYGMGVRTGADLQPADF